MTEQTEASAWWSQFEVDPGRGLEWDLDVFRLIVFRKEGEWLLVHERTVNEETQPGFWKVTQVSEAPSDHPSLVRFVAARETSTLQLLPRAADRSVVVKPHLPLHLLAAQEAKIYVSSPVWLDVTVGRRTYTLCEIPIRKLSDTWFGPNTLDGEVAYALKTRARVQLAETPMRAYRIITPIIIRNEDQNTLLIDRMNLPVPYLSIYAAEGDLLWTESVKLIHNQESELASLEIGEGPPPEARGAERLSMPRQTAEASFLIRAFTGLFSPFQ